jgi:YVTN family beta-propeller protein
MPGVYPKSKGIDVQTKTHYVASRTENNLYVLDTANNQLVTKVPVGETPYGVAVDADAKRAYVANAQSNDLTVINLNDNSVVTTIDLGEEKQPAQVAVNPATHKAYVTLHQSGQLAVIDTTSNTLSKIVSDLPGAFDVVVNQEQNQVYVSARNGHYVSILSGDTDSQVTRLNPGGETYAMAYDSVIKQLYIIIDPDGPLYLLDLPTDSLYLPLPNLITEHDPNPNVVLVFEVKPNYDFGRRGYVIAGQAGVDGGVGIAADPSTGNVFVSNAADNTLTVFDGPNMNIHATLAMDGNPGDVAVNSVTKRAYVSNRSANVVHMIVDGW